MKYDLIIDLSPSQRLHAQTWVNTLLSMGSCIFAVPIFDGVKLHVNACDVAQMLELNEPEATSHLDLQRLKSAALKELRKIKTRKRDPILIRHYESMIQMIAKENVGAPRVHQTCQYTEPEFIE